MTERQPARAAVRTAHLLNKVALYRKPQSCLEKREGECPSLKGAQGLSALQATQGVVHNTLSEMLSANPKEVREGRKKKNFWFCTNVQAWPCTFKNPQRRDYCKPSAPRPPPRPRRSNWKVRHLILVPIDPPGQPTAARTTMRCWEYGGSFLERCALWGEQQRHSRHALCSDHCKRGLLPPRMNRWGKKGSQQLGYIHRQIKAGLER